MKKYDFRPRHISEYLVGALLGVVMPYTTSSGPCQPAYKKEAGSRKRLLLFYTPFILRFPSGLCWVKFQ